MEYFYYPQLSGMNESTILLVDTNAVEIEREFYKEHKG